MSGSVAVEWTDDEVDLVARAICGQRYSGKPVRETCNPLDHRDARAVLDALAPLVAAREAQAAAKELRQAAEQDAITIPDILGYKVAAVAVEDILNRADAIERRPSEAPGQGQGGPGAGEAECCASGRCEVCTPGHDWTRWG